MSAPRRSFYILLPLVTVIVTLLIAELAFSLFYPVPFSLERNMYYEPDPYTGFRHRPLAEGTYLNGIRAAANSRGQRDDEVEIPKPPDVFRIMAIGDSFTAGANVEQSEAYPEVLERLLNDGSGQRRIEVVNTGTGGWAPFQYAEFVEHYAAPFEPDLLLAGFFVGNDSYVDRFRIEDTLTAIQGRRVSRDTALGIVGATKVWLYERSHIARLLFTQSFNQHRFGRQDCGDFNKFYLGLQKSRMSNHLASPDAAQRDLLERNVAQMKRIRDWADARGIRLIVFVIPDENQINPLLQDAILTPAEKSDYDFLQPQRLLKPLFALNDIEAVDLQPLFLEDSRCLYMNDSHWTPEGHALVAETIRDYLRPVPAR